MLSTLGIGRNCMPGGRALCYIMGGGCDYKWVTLAQLAAIAEQVLGEKHRNLVQDLQELIKNDDS